MTDAHLMDADCIHGYVWWGCQICEDEAQDALEQLQAEEGGSNE